jgi:hypothetical protein
MALTLSKFRRVEFRGCFPCAFAKSNTCLFVRESIDGENQYAKLDFGLLKDCLTGRRVILDLVWFWYLRPRWCLDIVP